MPAKMRRAGSFVLLALGVVLVYVGLAWGLGFSTSGMVASAAAIVALLYAGGVWFGGAAHADGSVLLFTPALVVASGPFAGQPIADLFDVSLRAGIEAACRQALAGQPSRSGGGARLAIRASPVLSPDGVIVYGLLLSGSVVDAPVVVGIGDQ